MAEPFLAEIRIMSFSFAPRGWALCNGQLLPINQNQGLFSLLGTTYGGDGRVNFALPNLQGRVPVHMGSSITLGQSAGSYAETINVQQMPQHTHVVNATGNAATTDTPASTHVLATAGLDLYGSATNLVAMEPATVSNVGGSQPHNNTQPYTTLNFSIALQGIFPSQN
jgi:microcystin-dependent protein